MGIEIERKFLVVGDGWRASTERTLIRQGYLLSDGERTVRVRVRGDAGFITIKGRPRGLTRAEFEYAIPMTDANEMLDQLCSRPLIEKVRHIVWHEGLRWEVDEFLNENAPLVVAEIELTDEAQAVPLPVWAGEEVTNDWRYANSNLARKPFSTW